MGPFVPGDGPGLRTPEGSFEARVEHFLLMDPSHRDGEPIGSLRHVTIQLEGVDWQVEQDLELFEVETRVHHLERHRADQALLTHRELRPGEGRTVRARWPLAGSIPPLGRAARERDWEPQVIVWSPGSRRTTDFEGARGWRGPLSLIEALRWSLLRDGEVARFDPLSSRPEIVRLETRHLTAFPAIRIVQAYGDLGASRGRWIFLGDELLGLSWQGGGPVAVRVGAEEHARALARFGLAEEDTGTQSAEEAPSEPPR